jgi:L-lactate utilization protein LutB
MINYKELKRNFESHGFITHYFESSKDAKDYLAKTIQGRTVGFGGSVTIREMKLFEALSEKNVTVWHHQIAGDEIKQLASHTKVYITSANGVSKTGEIVNIDGAGNRIAMTLYGPEKVYYVIGKNKIANDLPGALYRAKNIACPKNAQRQHVKTPCAIKGDKCYDCNSPERICNCTIILDRAPNTTSSEILFINENLGF